MRRIRQLLGIAVLVSLASSTSAVEPAGIFSDHMVLQRDMPVSVWGTGQVGEDVTVRFQGQTKSTTVANDGTWMLRLAPMTASATPQSMTINSIRFNDILIGEVWIASGQSNMAGGADLSAEDQALNIRTSVWTERIYTPEPREVGWIATGRTSEVALGFAREIAGGLKVPVGMIVRAIGGSPIQSWMPKDVADAYRVSAGFKPGWNDDATEGAIDDNHQSGEHFHPLMEPVIPYGMRGVIWYQGERNAKRGTYWHYREMQLMIKSWRQLWAASGEGPMRAFPFVSVQVPCYSRHPAYDIIRDSMRRVAANDPHVGLAVFYDNGRQIHPPNRHVAGYRMAKWALNRVYGFDDVVACPVLTHHTVRDNRVQLRFDHVGAGLTPRQGTMRLDFFELCGSDGVYYPANATIIDKATVILASDKVPAPVHARYLCGRSDTLMSLYNSADLPASPFITDPELHIALPEGLVD